MLAFDEVEAVGLVGRLERLGVVGLLVELLGVVGLLERVPVDGGPCTTETSSTTVVSPSSSSDCVGLGGLIRGRLLSDPDEAPGAPSVSLVAADGETCNKKERVLVCSNVPCISVFHCDHL